MHKMRKVIVIHGTPGTGKTTISRYLCKKLNAYHVNLSKLVREEKLYIGVDEKRSFTLIADVDKLIQKILDIISKYKGYVIVEGHFADIVPKEYVKKVIVIRLHPLELEKRLIKRGWPEKKIAENVLAEILDECLIEAINTYSEELVREVNATGKNVEEIIEEIMQAIKNHDFKPGRINWLRELEKEGIIEKYLTYLTSKT